MANLSHSVAAELITLLFRYVPAVLAANFVNASLVVIALWRHADHRVLLGWFAAIMALSFLRFALWLSHRRYAGAGAPHWGRRYTWGSAASGLIWGSAAFLFIHPGNPISLILISFVIGGMGAGAVTSLSAHLPAFYLYLFASMLPLELRLISLGDRTSLAMAGMAVVYIIGLVLIGRTFHAALIHSMTLNEENKVLLATREQEVMSRTADLQAANLDLERARTEAEHANQAKSRFLAAASHDLRQPLQSMFLFAASLHYHLRDKKGKEALVRIERGLDILKGLLDSLLDLSQLDIDVIKPKFATFPLRPMLDEIVAAYGRVAISKGIALECGPLAGAQVRSDPMLLGRMVRNLVENALRYTERGRIVLSSHAVGGRVRIEVEDTGIGIAPDQLGRIFEEFHQIGNPERDKARGLGLGLSIVQRLSRVLDHRVKVRSEPGIGSTFSIDLPAAEETIAQSGPEPADMAIAGGSGQRAIIIDDDPMVLLALNCVLEQWGYGVTMAGSEEEAVECMKAEITPDLIVADYRLRNGRVGTDAIRGVRTACGTTVPSIVLTGETGTEWVAEAEALGAIVLHKPVTPHDLAFALKRLTGANTALFREV